MKFLVHCFIIAALLVTAVLTVVPAQDATSSAGRPPRDEAELAASPYGNPIRNTAEFAAAIADPDRTLIFCPHPIVLTQPHDFGDKHLILGPGALDFSGGGTLRGTGSISRIASHADYPVFMNAAVGFWHYYNGSVTYEGTNYAPLPGQGTPPSVDGSWNGHERDVTYWDHWHNGRINDAIEA